MRIAVGIVHGHAPKWLQIVITSLKKHYNKIPFDIFIRASWPDHPSLKALTETKLGENVNIKNCKILWRHGPQFSRDLGAHPTGLDEIVDSVSCDEYDYLFTLETDCQIMKDRWLDWYVGHVPKINHPNPGMLGFFWEWKTSHYNINPSATLYNLRMLKEYQEEVRNNKGETMFHKSGNRPLSEFNVPPIFGVFSERRGIQFPNPMQYEMMDRGVIGPGVFEPGAWLFYRSLGEWGHMCLPCDHLQKNWTPKHYAPFGTFYGGFRNAYVIHYWAGTRAWDELKHKVEDPFVKDCSNPWKEREHQLWLKVVSEEDRKIMPEILKEMGV